MTSPARKTRTRKPAETEDTAPVETAACNLDGCTATPEWRGLCSAHRQTHRGLADQAE